MREKLKEIASDTILKCKNDYLSLVEKSINYYYAPNKSININKETSKILNIRIIQQTTIDAVINNTNNKYLVLNFASAKHPGGGFIDGAKAQEEALVRSSTLYPLLKSCSDFYNLKDHAPYYSDKMIYTENAYIIKNDNGDIIEPIQCDVITCAAPNYSAISNIDIETHKNIIEKRFTKIIEAAIIHKQRNLILGAWGCGVFSNPSDINAKIFGKVLSEYSYYFDDVIFAIPDDKNFTIFTDNL